jgi:hypothetical protein
VLAALALAVLPGCVSDADDCFRPIDEFLPSPSPRTDADAATVSSGQCGPWVEIGGEGYDSRYVDTRWEGWRFEVDDGVLEPFEEARQATLLVGSVTEAATWSVRGLDPADFLVMRSARDGEFFFVVRHGAQRTTDVDAVLCRYASGGEFILRERCGDG